MPQIIRFEKFRIYFWSDEGEPLEPIHVHASEGVPNGNSTKIWITRNGRTLIEHNKSKIPDHKLRTICDLIEARSFEIIAKWQEYFGQISFYC